LDGFDDSHGKGNGPVWYEQAGFKSHVAFTWIFGCAGNYAQQPNFNKLFAKNQA